MIAKGGDRLLGRRPSPRSGPSCCTLADVVTPNVPEAEVLAGMTITTLDDMRAAARRIRTLGPRVVVVKGGHLPHGRSRRSTSSCTPDTEFDLTGPRIETAHTHGTGCTFASAIAANLALGPAESTRRCDRPRAYLEGAIRHAPGLGSGHGPLNHFWRLY